MAPGADGDSLEALFGLLPADPVAADPLPPGPLPPGPPPDAAAVLPGPRPPDPQEGTP